MKFKILQLFILIVGCLGLYYICFPEHITPSTFDSSAAYYHLPPRLESKMISIELDSVSTTLDTLVAL